MDIDTTSGGVDKTFLAIIADFVVLSEVGVSRLLWDLGRLDDGWWRDESRLAKVDAGISLALCDEVCGIFVGDDLKVVRSADMCEVDGRGGPESEDDGLLLLSHGDVLSVVVPVEAEGVELALKFTGDGRDDGMIGIGEEVTSLAEEGERLVAEEIVDLAPDEWSDGWCVGHSALELVREEFGKFYEGEEGGSWREVTCVAEESYACVSGTV